MGSRKKFIAVAVVVTVALAYLLITGLVSYSMHQVEVAEVILNPNNYKDKGLKISGTVIDGSINKTQEFVTFNIKSEKSDAVMEVSYKGIIPDAFMEEATVIMEGIYDTENKMFMANKLMTKCPSRYEGMDMNEHNKAMAEKNANI